MKQKINNILAVLLFFPVICFSQVQKKTLVILGDSLTEGYGVAQQAAFPQLIEKKIEHDQLPWKLLSSGSSGSTSASALQRLKWIAKNKINIVVLLLGSNDGLRGLKPAETKKNLQQAITWAKENKIEVILGQLYVPPNYGKSYADDFQKIYKELAQENKIVLAPFLLDQVAGDKNLNQADGIHPNEKGHRIIADAMYEFLKKYLTVNGN